jgi:hypothetical protein
MARWVARPRRGTFHIADIHTSLPARIATPEDGVSTRRMT